VHATNFSVNPARKIKITQIDKLDKRLIVADSMDKDPRYVELDRITTSLRSQATRYNPLYGQIGLQVFAYEHLTPVALVSDRHKGGSNAIFLDGSVKWLKYEDLMFKKDDDDFERGRKIEMWDYRELKIYYNYER
jgi:prepilin-type processing-associated H-X9-DG protein